MAAYSRHYGRLAGCCAPAAGYLEGLGDDPIDPSLFSADPSTLYDFGPLADPPVIADPISTLWDFPGVQNAPIDPALISADPSLVDPSSPNYVGPIASAAGLTASEIASLTAAGVKVASTAIAPTSAGAAPRVTVAMPPANSALGSPIIAGMSNTTLMLGLAAAGILLTVVMGSRK